MFRDTHAFSSFSVDDLDKAREFYGTTLGIETTEQMALELKIGGGGTVFIYPKMDHQPATFTVLNFPVDDIDGAVKALKEKGITFESYSGDIATDGDDIFRGSHKGMGPDIAWFKDPAGNVLSVVRSPR